MSSFRTPSSTRQLEIDLHGEVPRAKHLQSSPRACRVGDDLCSHLWCRLRSHRAEFGAGCSQRHAGVLANRDQPIQIKSASLEMRDIKKEATFSGNVKVVQGDTTMTSGKLTWSSIKLVSPPAAPANARGAAGTTGAFAIRNPRSRRQLVDQAAGGARGDVRVHPGRPGCDRGDCGVRH